MINSKEMHTNVYCCKWSPYLNVSTTKIMSTFPLKRGTKNTWISSKMNEELREFIMKEGKPKNKVINSKLGKIQIM